MCVIQYSHKHISTEQKKKGNNNRFESFYHQLNPIYISRVYRLMIRSSAICANRICAAQQWSLLSSNQRQSLMLNFKFSRKQKYIRKMIEFSTKKYRDGHDSIFFQILIIFNTLKETNIFQSWIFLKYFIRFF